MKKIILFTILAIFTSALIAQTTEDEGTKKTKEEKKKEKLELREEKKFNKEKQKKEKKERPKEVITLMGKVDSHGGYAAMGMSYSEINKIPAMSFNARGSWVIGHAFAFGIGGTGFVSDFQFNEIAEENTSYQGGYGGLYFEPIILPRFPVHISFPMFIGAGGIAEIIDFTNFENYETSLYDASSFLLFEPGVELELNFFKHLRIAFGATYRYPATINFSNSTLEAEKALEGLTMGVTFKIGKF